MVSTVKFNNNLQVPPLLPADVAVVASPPFFSRPAAGTPRRAYSQASPGLQLRVQFLHHSVSVVCRYGRAAIQYFKNTFIIWIASQPVGLEKKGNFIKN